MRREPERRVSRVGKRGVWPGDTPKASAAGQAGGEEQPSAGASDEICLTWIAVTAMMAAPAEPGSRALFCDPTVEHLVKAPDMEAGMTRLKVEQHGNPTAGAWEARSGD